MRILGKNGLIYNIMAIAIYFLMPLIIIIMLPVMWLYEKITEKEF